MLIDYSVTNYRSFREKQTLSLVAAPKLGRKENVFRPDVPGEALPDLLKVAVIYGPNASGKSNALKALDAVRDMVIRQPSATTETLPVTPFRFDSQLADRPSEFELNFIAARRRFKFVLAATNNRIVREQLIEFFKGRESLLYERAYGGDADRYEFGEVLEGGRSVHETWQRLTAPQSLFLAQAVANSSGDLRQLRTPLVWLRENLMVLPAGLPMKSSAKVSQLVSNRNSPFSPEEVVSFIRDLDIPIAALKFETLDDHIHSEDPGTIDRQRWEKILSSSKVKAILTHMSALGSADFDFEEESAGTQNLVGFFNVWSVLRRSSSTQLLAIDEFDASLHPQIVARLVKQHIDLKESKQLIFTTHDTHLMDAKILRRDQIWLTERDINGATQLRAVHDFEGRESEDVEKRYYEGRYRGLPILRDSTSVLVQNPLPSA